MNATLKGKVSEVFAKYNFSPEDAQFLTDVLQEIDDRQRSEFEAKLNQLLTQKDKVDLIDRIQGVETSLTRQVYIVGLIQFLAIVGALIGIINFALK